MRLLKDCLGFLERLALGNVLTARLRGRARMAQAREEEVVWRYYAACVLDLYIVLWVLLELALLGTANWWSAWLLVTAVAYRLVEVCQALANAVLFDQQRSAERGRVPIHGGFRYSEPSPDGGITSCYSMPAEGISPRSLARRTP